MRHPFITFVLSTALIFAFCLFLSSLYVAVLSKLLTGDYAGLPTPSDLPDMAIFATVLTSASVVYRRLHVRAARIPLLIGFLLVGLALVIVLTANKFIVTYPGAGYERLFLVVSVIGFTAHMLIIWGFIKHVSTSTP